MGLGSGDCSIKDNNAEMIEKERGTEPTLTELGDEGDDGTAQTGAENTGESAYHK